MPPELADLFLAYRQAKNTVFLEQRGVGLSRFAEFEADLHRNLTQLRSQLGEVGSWFDNVSLGRIYLVPKAIVAATRPRSRNATVVVDGQPPIDKYNINVRLQLAGSVPLYIAEIMFLWDFGAALDAVLCKESVGYRVTRRMYHTHARKIQRHLFAYWPVSYQEFRSAPMTEAREIIRRNLTHGDRGCFLASLDLSSFYDSIDPAFLLRDDFIERVEGATKLRGIAFDAARYASSCGSLLRLFARYRKSAGRITGHPVPIGIPIGALTSRIVANVALQPLDAHILSRRDVRCYRRYVDDMLIVAELDRRQAEADPLATWLPFSATAGKSLRLDQRALLRDGSDFHLQPQKIQTHFLCGSEGLDFLDGIQSDLRRISSERRSFFEISAIHSKAIASLVRSSNPERSSLRVLREVDRSRLLSRELSTSLIFLTRAVTLLNRDDARLVCRRSLSPAARALTHFADWADGREFVPRILKIAVLADDWATVEQIAAQTDAMWGSAKALAQRVSRLTWNGKRLTVKASFSRLRQYLHRLRYEAICQALPVDSAAVLPQRFALTFGMRRIGISDLLASAKQFAAADLRLLDRDDESLRYPPSTGDNHGALLDELNLTRSLRERFETISAFIDRCRNLRDRAWDMSPVAIFLATRPPSYFDIARRILFPKREADVSEDPFAGIVKTTNAIRGTGYTDTLGTMEDEYTIDVAGANSSAPSCRLILGNLVTADAWFSGAATRTAHPFGSPVLGVDRLVGLSQVLRRADHAARRGSSDPMDSLLVLPELAVPRAWMRAVAKHAVNVTTFSIVMGLEYQHHPSSPWVYNQVLGVFPAPYKSAVVWYWTKGNPAQVEHFELEKRGVALAPPHLCPGSTRVAPRAVLRSRFGDISVLVCSELIEADLVGTLVGRVELLLAPSWNQDTDAYDHLIQAVGLQTLGIVAVCNNGHYSDCRVWAPKQERWERDVCRLVHRDVDEVVWADIPIATLRAFRRAGRQPAPEAKKNAAKSQWRPLPPGWPRRRR